MTGGHGSNRDDGASAFLFDKMEPERQFLVRSLPPRDARSDWHRQDGWERSGILTVHRGKALFSDSREKQRCPAVGNQQIDRVIPLSFESVTRSTQAHGDMRHDGARLDGVHRARAAPCGISQRPPTENVCPLLNVCVGRVAAVSDAACRSVRRQPHPEREKVLAAQPVRRTRAPAQKDRAANASRG